MKLKALFFGVVGSVVLSAAPAVASQGDPVSYWVDVYETGQHVSKAGKAKVTGNVHCADGDVYTLTVQVDQRVSAPAVGAATVFGTCTGGDQAFVVTVGAPRKYTVGEAYLSASLTVCTEDACSTVGSNAIAQLTR